MSDARLIVPALDKEPWPTLGPEVCDWVETFLCHGPGDVLGEPVTLTDELRLLIYRAYEVYPRDHRLAGRRRFKRVVFSRRKGVGKTELASWIGIAEMDPGAPVRCDGWRKESGAWVPVGRPVLDPYIPMVAVTEEQTEDLAYAAVREILERCPLADDYDIGLERIMHKRAPGKMQALASAPSARDGARTSFEHFDETHHFVSQKLRDAHATMLRNLPKRKEADAWALETTTMYAPGEESVAEASHRYAEAVARGELEDPRLLFDHRQASERHDISTKRGLMAAIKEASGDAWGFTDAESIAAQLVDPQTDENDFRRYWLNQRRKSSRRWLSRDMWDRLGVGRGWPEDGARIVLAFDGSYSRDSTILLGATVDENPHLFLVSAWEKPLGAKGWRTPRSEVDAEIEQAMERWDVAELVADPPGWHRELEDWQGQIRRRRGDRLRYVPAEPDGARRRYLRAGGARRGAQPRWVGGHFTACRELCAGRPPRVSRRDQGLARLAGQDRRGDRRDYRLRPCRVALSKSAGRLSHRSCLPPRGRARPVA